MCCWVWLRHTDNSCRMLSCRRQLQAVDRSRCSCHRCSRSSEAMHLHTSTRSPASAGTLWTQACLSRAQQTKLSKSGTQTREFVCSSSSSIVPVHPQGLLGLSRIMLRQVCIASVRMHHQRPGQGGVSARMRYSYSCSVDLSSVVFRSVECCCCSSC
jgi:hypothetical protein